MVGNGILSRGGRSQLARILDCAAVLGLCLRGARGDFRAVCSIFTTAKMDPVVQPGEVSGHYHDVVGSLGFDVYTDVDAMMQNDTTCTVTGDFSNYWGPAFYHVNLTTNESTRLKGFFKAYYGTGRLVNRGLTVQMPDFPRNLSMVTYDAHFVCRGGPKNRQILQQYGKRLPDNGYCPFIRIVYQFPACWNGQQYAPDQSHMTYAANSTGFDLGRCPDSHPQHIFFVRLEHNFNIPRRMQRWEGPAPFVLASGGLDTAHADATLVWNREVLGNVSRRCATADPDTCDVVLGRIPGAVKTRLRTEAIAREYEADPIYTNGSGTAPYVPSLESFAPTPAPSMSYDSMAPTWAPTPGPFASE